ncbi:hypothetical protein CYMTET_46505 [Cymbomonas tetramitiformis]|uniref:C-type lectin domain-containing protein n=1 Tax=Cymbomonas tetramitiformis TaxID=36881 RepID=A0AAE0EX84_9CHLO|nr:hypothetical protein CYMTET_46505 [Cymbomonas tetramitiformis]
MPQLDREVPAPDGDPARSAASGRHTVSNGACVLPFTIHGNEYLDCMWRTDDNGTYKELVEGQARWTCPYMQDYDQDSEEAVARYFVHGNAANNLSGMDHRQACAEYGAQPAHIRSAADEQVLWDLADSLGSHLYISEWRGWGLWIGLGGSRTHPDVISNHSEFHFAWMGNGEEINTTHGYNNLYHIESIDAPDEHCVMLWKEIRDYSTVYWRWFAVNCAISSGVAFACNAPTPTPCGLPPQMDLPSGAGQCAMQGRAAFVEGRDLRTGYHAIEICGLDPAAAFSLKGWDKSFYHGWSGGSARLVTSGNRWSDPITVLSNPEDPTDCGSSTEAEFSPSSASRDNAANEEIRKFLQQRGYKGMFSPHVTSPVDGACKPGHVLVRGLTNATGANTVLRWGIQDASGLISELIHVEGGMSINISHALCLDTAMEGLFRVVLVDGGGNGTRVDVVNEHGCALGRVERRPAATCKELGWKDDGGIPGVCGISQCMASTRRSDGFADWWESDDFCASFGARLCTLHEVIAGESYQHLNSNATCNINILQTWTSTPCWRQEDGAAGYAAISLEYNAGEVHCESPVFEDGHVYTMGGRCCADVEKQGKAWQACPRDVSMRNIELINSSTTYATCCDSDGDCDDGDADWCCDGLFFCTTNELAASTNGDRFCAGQRSQDGVLRLRGDNIKPMFWMLQELKEVETSRT